jgi:hypothetical protein
MQCLCSTRVPSSLNLRQKALADIRLLGQPALRQAHAFRAILSQSHMLIASEQNVNRNGPHNNGPPMTDLPVHDWLRPRLRALVGEAARAGFDRQTVIAILIDEITGPGFNNPRPDKEQV